MMKYKKLLAFHCLHDPLASLEPIIAMAKSTEWLLEIRVLNLVSPILTMTASQTPEYDSGTDIMNNLKKLMKEKEFFRVYLIHC
ncbi:MAG: hypothetical protein ACI9XK_001678 [Granulosicoccus sp.]|jgi:hypothetical protein